MQLSVTIVTLNEERNIARALRSVPFADEVVVVDSGSRDRTREIAAALGARVIEERWRGYAAQKNFAAEQAAYTWILSIDADEEVGPELAAEILRLKGEEPAADGYAFPRLARYLGKWIRHSGWYPDRKVRLYRKDRARWTGDYVHESVRVEGAVAQLHGDLLHYTCDSLAEHYRTLDRYTTLAARELRARGRSVGALQLVLSPAWTFVKSYVLQRGFLDGAAGLTIARMAAIYTFRKYSKAREGDWRESTVSEGTVNEGNDANPAPR